MANQIKTNIVLDPTTANNSFSLVWWLTRVMKKAGWRVAASSDGLAKDTSGDDANDKWGPSADPLADTYPTAFDTRAPWIVLSGPETVKVSLGATPSGTFLRGEGVTQATSGATGELLGVVINAAGDAGWAILMPRTGTFDATHVITGDTSSASMTPTATATFTREVVFWKSASNVYDGSVYYVCANQATESASLFSTMATNANCTATVAPGGSPTAGNQFPAIAICCRGTAAVPSGSAASHTPWFHGTNTFGRGQVSAVNAIPSAGTSADGTFWATLYYAGSGSYFYGFGFFRLDDSEPGDVDPFAWYYHSAQGTSNVSAARTAATNNNSTSTMAWGNFLGALMSWRGYCARGTGGSKDSFVPMVGGATASSSYAPLLTYNALDTMRLANHPDPIGPVVQEPMVIAATSTGLVIRKGVARWIALMPVGAALDTFDDKSWLVVVGANLGTNPAIAFGPYDGVTTPVPT